MSDLKAPLRIRAETSSIDLNSIRFILDRDVQAGAQATFREVASAQCSPLAEALFAVTGVKRVDVSGAIVTVLKSTANDWTVLKHQIADVIRTIMAQTALPLGQDIKIIGQPRTDAEIRIAVQEVLDSQANPAIASHGGHVRVTDVQSGVVSMLMSGGCQGCASSAATLRGGVESMVRTAVPEVRDIIDVTDHTAGVTPYYSNRQDTAPSQKRPLLYRPVPPDMIVWEHGHFMVSPEYLAPRLGMDTQTLRAAMQSGEVVSQSEIGVGTDAGKTRLIIGSSQRIWAAEITNDGTAYEIPAPRAAINATNDRITLRDRIRGYLMDLAKTSAPITYGQLARALGLYAPGSIGKVTQALEATMVEDSESGVPFLAALVVSKIGDSEAAKGFHLQAQALGRGPSIDEDDTEYYRREFKGAIATITASSTVRTSRT